MTDTREQQRLAEAREQSVPWKRWGPYLSERQWGTVREDYSADGNAWDYFSHDQARSRAYRWGEDGIAGISDDKQTLCFALALWNGKDPIVKERLFGLTNSEGNHGEDVKEYYFYLDSTPTHSYMKCLYKYPQAAYPYALLVDTNKKRSRQEMEYELLDTGVFDDDRYFDVFVEYAKAGPEDILIRISVANRGPEPATLHVLPTLWFRNTWSWAQGAAKPLLKDAGSATGATVISASHPEFGDRRLYCEGEPTLLFTENETNNKRIFGTENATPYVKDAVNEYLVHRRHEAVNPGRTGTKAAASYRMTVAAGQTGVIRLRLTDAQAAPTAFGSAFDDAFAARLREADEFYRAITPRSSTEDEARVMRQAFAGMLWTKQYYFFDADRWLEEHEAHPLLGQTRQIRNREWYHMVNDHVISMPDKWEYPWYAAWDLAFHCIALAAVDPDFAREQLDLMLREIYMHPSGQIPAYEWNYSDVNPPVHAWATLFLHRVDQALDGTADMEFLKRSFIKLALNFNWWVNRKDRFGKNVFEGGFLGLDNIGVFDRSAPLPTGGHLEQADGTAWVALFCQNMIELSVELAAADPSYQDMCTKFVEHFFWIASGMNRTGPDGMWDEEDGFYYDVLRLPDGSAQRLKVRSMVGLLPLCATTVIEQWQRERVPEVTVAWMKRLKRMPELMQRHPRDGARSRGRRRPRDPCAGRRRAAAADPRADARREGVPQPLRVARALPLPPRASVRLQGRHAGVPGGLPACRVRFRNVRRQLQLARPGLDAGERAHHPRAAAVLPLLRRRLQGRVPDRLGPDDEPLRSEQGAREPSRPHLPARREGPPAGVRRRGEVPDRSALARLHPVLRVLPRRQRRRARREPSDRLDGPRRAPDPDVRRARAAEIA